MFGGPNYHLSAPNLMKPDSRPKMSKIKAKERI